LPEVSELTSGQKTVLEPVGELENQILSQINPVRTASEISKLIESLPKDDPAARILLDRLYYLRGLNYELHGQKELALDAYLDLIAFAPESLWSQYAKIRIQITSR
jgi:hypothetical protein